MYSSGSAHHAPSSLFLRRKIRPSFSSSTAGNVSLSPLLTHQRKLLCPPPRGKFVREDYLVKKLSAEELQELVKGERKVPVIVDFYATWCGPCILMAQELEMVHIDSHPSPSLSGAYLHYSSSVLTQAKMQSGQKG
ncbi:unnamed protein product [Brassica oleracea]